VTLLKVKGSTMQLRSLIRSLFKPKLDPAALVVSATAVHGALVALEAYLEATGDAEAVRLVRRLHKALGTAWNTHSANAGITVQPFSAGIKPD
jgi:hypothetical protein